MLVKEIKLHDRYSNGSFIIDEDEAGEVTDEWIRNMSWSEIEQHAVDHSISKGVTTCLSSRFNAQKKSMPDKP